MARATTKTRAARPAPVASAGAPAATQETGIEQVVALNAQQAQWARDALEASLLQTQGLFTFLQALQQAQARALHDAAADIERAIEALRSADDGAALAAVPGRFVQSQWQHALENLGSTAGRLMEIESAWLQQAQAQAAKQMAAVGATGEGLAVAVPTPQARGNGADEAAEAWAQWVERWQHGVDQMQRAWTEAVREARPGG